MDASKEIGAAAAPFCQAVAGCAPFHPLYVKIKLTAACNLRCQMCNHWREVREAPLPTGRVLALIGELAAAGCRKVHLTGGEPLLRPDLLALVTAARAAGLRTTMTTNGTLAGKELVKDLVAAGLRGVNISLDSPDRSVHDQVRGVPGAWKAAVKALERFGRCKHKGKLTLRVNTTVSRLNYRSLVSLPDLLASLGVDDLNLIAVDDHWGDALTLHRRELEDYNAAIAPRLGERAVALGLIPDLAAAYPFGQDPAELRKARSGYYAFGWYERHPCYAPWVHSFIDYNGLVYACCMTRERIAPLGDLRVASFDQVWEGPAYARLREMMHPPRLSQCRRCDDFVAENRGLWAIERSA